MTIFLQFKFNFIAVCLLLPICLYHLAFCYGIHLSSSLFGADGATWQGHGSQSIPTLSSAGISICHSALPSRLGVACWRETSLCVCVLGKWGRVVEGWASLYCNAPLFLLPVIHLSKPKPVSWWGSEEHHHFTSTMTITVPWRWEMAANNSQSQIWHFW